MRYAHFALLVAGLMSVAVVVEGAPPGLAVAAAKVPGMEMKTWPMIPRYHRLSKVLQYIAKETPDEVQEADEVTADSIPGSSFLALGPKYIEDFVVIYTGCLNVKKKSDDYTLWLRATSKATIYVDDVMKLTSDHKTGEPIVRKEQLHLGKGLRLLKIVYWKEHGEGRIVLEAGWSGPGVQDRVFSTKDVFRAGPQGNSCLDSETKGLSPPEPLAPEEINEEAYNLKYDADIALNTTFSSEKAYDAWDSARNAARKARDTQETNTKRVANTTATVEISERLSAVKPDLDSAQVFDDSARLAAQISLANDTLTITQKAIQQTYDAQTTEHSNSVVKLANAMLVAGNVTKNPPAAADQPALEEPTGYKGEYDSTEFESTAPAAEEAPAGEELVQLDAYA